MIIQVFFGIFRIYHAVLDGLNRHDAFSGARAFTKDELKQTLLVFLKLLHY
jgi:hypothetical protein